MATNPWFRLYSKILDDEKLRLLAFEDRWHFVSLLCLKNDGLLDNTDDPLFMRKIAVKMGLSAREVEEVARRLGEVGLIDENLQPVKWDERQFKTDKSNDRVKAYRERMKKSPKKASESSETQCNGSVTLHETLQKHRCNVSVTAQETDTDTDTDTDTELKHTPPNPPRGKGRLEKDFDRFWAMYPKKKSKGQALAAWKKLKPDEQLVEKILSSIEQAKTSCDWLRDSGQYIKHPATWLNAMGWDDELTFGEPHAPSNQHHQPARKQIPAEESLEHGRIIYEMLERQEREVSCVNVAPHDSDLPAEVDVV